MQGIDFEIIYIKGKYNAVEKSLSIDKSPPIYIPLHILFECAWKKIATNGKKTIALDRKYNVYYSMNKN